MKSTLPGDILFYEFCLIYHDPPLKDVDLILEVIRGKKVDNRTATALARITKTSRQFWLNLQKNYDMEK